MSSRKTSLAIVFVLGLISACKIHGQPLKVYAVSTLGSQQPHNSLAKLGDAISAGSKFDSRTEITPLIVATFERQALRSNRAFMEIVDGCRRPSHSCVFVLSAADHALSVSEIVEPLPVIFVSHGDPFGRMDALGRVHRKKNLTGFDQLVDVSPKWIEILHRSKPQTKRLGLILDERSEDDGRQATGLSLRAASLGINLRLYPLKPGADLKRLFSAIQRDRCEGLIIPMQQALATRRTEFFSMVRESGLPNIVESSLFLKDGAWFAYEADPSETIEVIARQVRLVMSGVAIADIPVEHPKKFRFWVNLKEVNAAKFPLRKSLLASATDFIE